MVTVVKIQRSRSSFPATYGTLQTLVLAWGSQDREIPPKGAAASGTHVPGIASQLPGAHRTHPPPAASVQEIDGVNAGIVQM